MDNTITLYDWSSQSASDTPLAHDFIDRLDEYLNTIWKSRVHTMFEHNNNNTKKQRIIRFDRKGYISAEKYVGIVHFENQTIEIKPRIIKNKESKYNWSLNCIFWLSYASRINFPINLAKTENQHSDDFLQIMIDIFSRYTQRLIIHQPFSDYTKEDCETRYLKGSLLFEKYASENLAKGKWHQFHVSHTPFIFDNSLNRIIKCVIKQLLPIAKNSKDELTSILFLLDEVTDISCESSDCDRILLSSFFSEYRDVLDMCKMFLNNLVVDLNTGAQSNFCFLLPMDYLYEGFVLGFLEKHFPEILPRGQESQYLGKREEVSIFKMKYDILVKKHNLIIDTKYKIRDSNIDNVGVNQSDVYQMLAYSTRSAISNVMLLYPLYDKSIENFSLSVNKVEGSPHPTHIHIRSLDILIESPKDIGLIKERILGLLNSIS